ncbi:MAG: hypothetical protein LQ339_000156 [Xanthoria mediterranea]|nr:MAG: hypothetical protein LQ339_000156 [Xanthoria mediterranea]
MSLNGLDATDINEAYQSALAEGGGWFLLKYATRDEVTLLNRGSGGVVDIRDTVAQYDDQSPLYGFVHYRRRKVILKYIPDGTSRLLRARVAVHFQAVTEHFTPHDTIFSFTSAKGLNDVALSSACSLHTASASIKSSSDSLRQRGLSGIAEDIGEYQPPATDVEPVADESEKGNLNGAPALHSRPERSDSLSNAKTSAVPPSIERRESTSPTRIRHIDKALPPTPNEHAEDRATTRNALEDTFLDSRPSAEGRPSIQSTRPSVRSTHTSHESKHKVKLGPRPSLDSFAGFHTQDWSGPIRPVSTLPNGVRLAARKQAPARSQSTRARPAVLETPKDPLPSQKPTSPVESKETPPPLPAGPPKQLQPAENRSSTMTPEKRRLKKALELRQKQLAARRAQELAEAEESQGHLVQPSCDLGKRESLTATLPDLSPADDSTTDVLQERIEALDRNPDLVHVGPQNVDKGVSENFEVSPISLLEASDGPSTQASSVSDEEETPCNTDPTAPNEVISGSPVDVSIHDQSISGTGTLLEPEHPLLDGRGDTPEPSGTDECKTEQSIINMTAANQSDNHKEDASFSTAPRGSPDSSESKTSVQETADKVPLIGELSDSLDTRVSKPPRIGSDRLIPHEIPLPLSDEEELGTGPEKKAIAEPLISNPHNEDATRQHLAPDQTKEGNGGLRDSRSSIDDIPKEQRERRARRHGLVSPIKRVSSPDYSDEQFLSDDSFMEELKSATVQEAKPISVSKSPIMPVFPRSVSDSKSTEEPRPASAASDLKRPKRRNDPPMMPKLPDLYSARSSSAPYAPLHEAQLSSPTLKKVGVSSGISQRIKLLEQLSSRPTSPSSQLSSPSTALGSSPAFPSTRKTSFRASQAAAEIARSSTHNSKSRPQLPHLSKSRSPDRNSNRMTDGVFRIDVATKSGKARPESISVTARIVRGSHSRISEVPEGVSRPRTSDLYPSPLTVEHQPTRPTSTPLSPLKPPNPRYARSMSSTSTAPKSDAARRDSISSRLSSTPSRRGSESELPRSMSDLSVNSMSNLDGSKDDKKESRKSRLFKRMSNISAASRRSIASALSPVRKDIKEEAIVEHHEPSCETIKPLAVEVGEVNIQFPDTLLWKRRHMKIEDEGTLVLSASKSDNNSKIVPKRYRLAEFHAPYLPDQDQQELPNSVVLDFRDGSTLQCACENAYAQTEVLQALKRAHRTSNPAR